MAVRFANISVRDAVATADLMRSWRGYYYNGLSFLMPTPTQSRAHFIVDNRTMQFRASGFALGDVMVLVNEAGGYNVVFYDQSLNGGQGGFLPAFASLSIQERTLLGARRSRREQFLRDLIAAARTMQPAKAPTRA